MSKRTLRIATRSSALALWQAEFIKAELERLHDNVDVELIKIKTQGDKILDVPLAKIGGKGLFVKELEEAMLDGRADLAVHSMKDVPMEFPETLCPLQVRPMPTCCSSPCGPCLPSASLLPQDIRGCHVLCSH